MNDVVVITGGGTGGHLSVARSLIDELYARNIKVIFIGSTKGADKQWFENEPKLFQKYFMDTKGVVNQNLIGKLDSLFMILKALFKCRAIYQKYNVTKVISVGGFSAAPASFSAIISKIDFYIHEQNSVMGKLNQITSKKAKAVFSSYEKDSLIKDYPINQKFFDKARVRKSINAVIFLGGSQGAKAINDFAINIVPFLKQNNIKIIHQTGKLDFQRVKEEYKRLKIEADIFDFTTDILGKMDQADFAISRSGASTLWELSALGLPALYIPYPYAAANHQYYNAKFLLDDNLCFLKKEDELDDEYFKQILQSDIKPISQTLIDSISQNGVVKIVDEVLR
ncbi:MAG: undecaprenyldiphospho-muramoylpentapeptide beta-N-acetylglucosaminyltransferase [Arcobacteraceae bacterium]|nr:undecaprenyldiphospho-muramoylpentapeptide beta-N-acetylglucosaminyltransferase [Arcobacteraceae bacterium]